MSEPFNTHATDDSSGILADISAAYLTKLVAIQTLESGFQGADASALGELVSQGAQFLANLCFQAKELAQTGRRSTVSSLDALRACESAGLDAASLRDFNERKREDLRVFLFFQQSEFL